MASMCSSLNAMCLHLSVPRFCASAYKMHVISQKAKLLSARQRVSRFVSRVRALGRLWMKTKKVCWGMLDICRYLSWFVRLAYECRKTGRKDVY